MKKVLAIVLSVLICVFSISCSSRAKKSNAEDIEKTGKEATFNSRPDLPQHEEQIDFDKRHTLTFSILNRTGIGIYEIYTKNTADSVWGENQLKNVLRDGEEIDGLTFEVSLSSVYFSIKIADKEGNALVFDRLDMSYSTEDPVVILTYTPQYDGSGNLDATSGYRAYGVDSSKKDTEDEKLSKVCFPGFEADGMSEEVYEEEFSMFYRDSQKTNDEYKDTTEAGLDYDEEYSDEDEDDEYMTDEMEYYIPDDAVFYDGHSYYVFNIKDESLSDYWDVEYFCEDIGGHLAVINSEDENDFLFDYIQDCGLNVAFFGYSDDNEEGEWEWVSGFSEYENWDDDQPNNGSANSSHRDENFAEFSKKAKDGSWNDAPFASNTYHFICEWDYT